jgi:hypothetical protein
MKVEGKFVPRGGLSLCVVAEHPNPSITSRANNLPQFISLNVPADNS